MCNLFKKIGARSLQLMVVLVLFVGFINIANAQSDTEQSTITAGTGGFALNFTMVWSADEGGDGQPPAFPPSGEIDISTGNYLMNGETLVASLLIDPSQKEEK